MIPLTYILLVAAHSLIDAYQIEKKGIYINHLREAILYALVCGVASLIIYLITDVYGWPLVIFPIVTRAAFFDGLLNLFRGKNVLYEGTASLIDRIERKIGLPVWFMRMFYLAIYITYLIIYLL